MTINRVISQLMKKTGCTQARMAKAIGVVSANAVGSKLNIDNMTFDRAVEMLNVIGYEVVVQPVTSGHRKEGAIVVDQIREPRPERKRKKASLAAADAGNGGRKADADSGSEKKATE